uniref:Uncharacterized protein n=1 Tax=Cucumis melo TaxID=3656 RepID=A0A9I9E6W2_CUCME
MEIWGFDDEIVEERVNRKEGLGLEEIATPIRRTLMMNPIKILWSLAFNATSESKPHIQIPITPPPSPSSDLKHKHSSSVQVSLFFL